MYALANIWWGLNWTKLWESLSCCRMFLHPFYWMGSNHLGRVQFFMLSASEERLPLCNCLYRLQMFETCTMVLLCHAKSPYKQQNITTKSGSCRHSCVFLIVCSSVVKLSSWNFTELALFLAETTREWIYSKHHLEPWVKVLAFVPNSGILIYWCLTVSTEYKGWHIKKILHTIEVNTMILFQTMAALVFIITTHNCLVLVLLLGLVAGQASFPVDYKIC